MTSSCPACGKSHDHDDNAFDVQCSQCGNNYNPQLVLTDLPAMDIPVVEESFQESTQAFQELRDYGENLPPAGMPIKEEKVLSVVSAAGESFLMSTLTFAEVKVKGMVSCVAMVENSLDKALQQLTDQAKKLGANAVFGIQVTSLGAPKEVLLIGTAVETLQK